MSIPLVLLLISNCALELGVLVPIPTLWEKDLFINPGIEIRSNKPAIRKFFFMYENFIGQFFFSGNSTLLVSVQFAVVADQSSAFVHLLFVAALESP
jgi:hypothetical protein